MTTRTKGPSAADLQRERMDAVGVLLSQARSALFITGPAVSIDSGLAMYRGIPGLERKKPEDGRLFETALSVETLRRKPEMTWKYLLRMEQSIRAVQPNRAHAVLLAIATKVERCTIMTVNVDRLHQRAGSKDVIEMHGALFDLLCSRCELSTRHDSFDALDIPPSCPTCGEMLRPDMPLFGEALPSDPFTRLQAELDAGFDMVFAIGVGTMFPYLARPVLVARSEGIPTIEIGVQRTDLSDVVDFRFKGTPSAVLDAIWAVTTRVSPTRRNRE
jgi:NAD-dependent deacetylase